MSNGDVIGPENLIPGEKIYKNDRTKDTKSNNDAAIDAKYVSGEIRIVTEQARYPLPTIQNMVESDSYILNPEFQRRRRWNVRRQSKLIESIIINIPIPPIFLYETEYSIYEVMDGLQRLTAISDFYKDSYHLEGLEEWPELNGRTYSSLPKKIRSGIDRRFLSSIVLLNETAKDKAQEAELKRLVFNRINSGGVELTPQESRNALISGKFNETCIRLSKDPNFRLIQNIENEEDGRYRTMEDVELVLRFFANRQRGDFQSSSIEKYLDFYLEMANNFSQSTIDNLSSIFISTMKLTFDIFGPSALDIYRPKKFKGSERWSWLGKPSDQVYDALTLVISQLLPKHETLILKRDDILGGLEKFYIDNQNIFSGRNVNKSDREARIAAFQDFLQSYL